MRTSVLFSVLMFLIGLAFVGSFFNIQGLGGDLPTAEQISSGNPAALLQLAQGLVPSPTGVLWFDLILGGLSAVLVIGAYRILNPLG
jgi:hypothetical protein